MGSSTSTISEGWDGSPTQIGSWVFQNSSGVVTSWEVAGTFIPSLSTVSAESTSSDWLFESLATSMFPSDEEPPTIIEPTLSEPFASSTGSFEESFIPSVSTFEIPEFTTSDVLSVSEIETSATLSSTEVAQHGISTRDDFLDYSSAASTSETYVSGSQISETLVAKHTSGSFTATLSSELFHSEILHSSEYLSSSQLKASSTATSEHALSLDTYSLLFTTLSSTVVPLSSVSETTHAVSELPFSTSVSPDSFQSDHFFSAFSSQLSVQLSGEGPSDSLSETSSAFYTSETDSSITEKLAETPFLSSTDELYSASKSDIFWEISSSPETLSAMYSSVDSEAPLEAVTSTISEGSSFPEYSFLDSEYIMEMPSSIRASSFIPSESSAVVELSTSVESPTPFESLTPKESSSATETTLTEELSSIVDSSPLSTSTGVQMTSSVGSSALVESSLPYSSSTEGSSGLMDSLSVDSSGAVGSFAQFSSSTYEYSSASERLSTDASTHETIYISEPESVTEQLLSPEIDKTSRVSSDAYPSDFLSYPGSSSVPESLVVSEHPPSSDFSTISKSTSSESSMSSETMSSVPGSSTIAVISSFAPESSTVSEMSSSVPEMMSSAQDILASSDSLVSEISSAVSGTPSFASEVSSSVPVFSSIPDMSPYSGIPSSSENPSVPEFSSFPEYSSVLQISSNAESSSTTDHSSGLESLLSSDYLSVESHSTSVVSYSELPSVSNAMSASQILKPGTSIALEYSFDEFSSSMIPESEPFSATKTQIDSSAQVVSSVPDVSSEYPSAASSSIPDVYSESERYYETSSASPTADLSFSGSTSDSILASSLVPENSSASESSAYDSSIPEYSFLESSDLESSRASVTLTYSSDLSAFEVSSLVEFHSLRSSSIDFPGVESSASDASSVTEISSAMESSTVVESSSAPEITSATELSSPTKFSSATEFSVVSSVPKLSSNHESASSQPLHESNVLGQSSSPKASESSYKDSESTWPQIESSLLGTTSISDDSHISKTVSSPYIKTAGSSFDSRAAETIATKTNYSSSESPTAPVSFDSSFLSSLPYSESAVVPTSSYVFVSSYTHVPSSSNESSISSETGIHPSFDFSASYISDGTKEVETSSTFSLGYESTSMAAESSSFDFLSTVTAISGVPPDPHINSESTFSSWVSLVLSDSLHYSEAGASFTEPIMSESHAASVIDVSGVSEDLPSSLFSELPKSFYSDPSTSRGSDAVYPTSLAGQPFTSSEPLESGTVIESEAESDFSSLASSESVFPSFESESPILSSDEVQPEESSFVDVSSIRESLTSEAASLSAEPASSFELSSAGLSFPFASQTLKDSSIESHRTAFESGESSSQFETSDYEISVSKTISSEADPESSIFDSSSYETSASGTLAHGSPSYKISSEDPWPHKTSAVESSAYETSDSDAFFSETPSQRPGEFETHGSSSEFVVASESSSGLLQSENSHPETSDDVTSEKLTLVSESSHEVLSFPAESGASYSSSYSDGFTLEGSSSGQLLSSELPTVATSTGVSKSAEESVRSSSLIDQSVTVSKITDYIDASTTGEAVPPTSGDFHLMSSRVLSDSRTSISSDVRQSTASSYETTSLDYSVKEESKTFTDTDAFDDTTTSDTAATSGLVSDFDSVSVTDSVKMALLTTDKGSVSEHGVETSIPPKTFQSSKPEGSTETKRISTSVDQMTETVFPVESSEATFSAVSSKTSFGATYSAGSQKPAFTNVAGVPFTVPDSDVLSTKHPDALGKHRDSESTRASGSSSTDSSATRSPASEISLSHEETSSPIPITKDAHAQSKTGTILSISLSTSYTSLLKTATASFAMEAGASKKAPSISWIFPILATFLS